MPKTRRVALAPDRMRDGALWERTSTLIAACRYERGATPRERDQYLDELALCLIELRMRGTQLQLTAD